MVFHPCIKQESGEIMVGKEEKNRKKRAQVDVIDLLDRFLAIDVCLL